MQLRRYAEMKMHGSWPSASSALLVILLISSFLLHFTFLGSIKLEIILELFCYIYILLIANCITNDVIGIQWRHLLFFAAKRDHILTCR